MEIKLTAKECLVNDLNADWHKDSKTIATMLKRQLGLV